MFCTIAPCTICGTPAQYDISCTSAPCHICWLETSTTSCSGSPVSHLL
jgi:hypothetical protein